MLKKIFDFYVFSNIHVGVAAFCFTKISLLMVENQSNVIPFWLFFATVVAYNFIRIVDVDLLSTNQINSWLIGNISLLIYTTYTAIIGLIILSFFVEFKALILLIILGFVTVLYVLPFLKNNNKTFYIREIPYVKIIFVVTIWTIVTVVIPIKSINFSTNSNEINYYIIIRFLLYLVLILPFEIRDVFTDDKSLKTLPQYIGIFNTKIFGLILLVFIALVNIYIIKKEVNSTNLILIITAIFIVFSSVKQSKYYSAFGVESIPVLWLLLLLFFYN